MATSLLFALAHVTVTIKSRRLKNKVQHEMELHVPSSEAVPAGINHPVHLYFSDVCRSIYDREDNYSL